MFSEADMLKPVTRAELKTELDSFATKEDLRAFADEMAPVADSLAAMSKVWPAPGRSQDNKEESEPQSESRHKLEHDIHEQVSFRLRMNNDVLHIRLSTILRSYENLHMRMGRLEVRLERIENLLRSKSETTRQRTRR